MPVVAVEKGLEAVVAFGGGVVRMSVGPLAEGGLDEALGLAVGLGSVRAGEAVCESELSHGGLHRFRAVTGAIVGVNALNLDAEALEESEGGVEEGDDTFGLFVWEDL